MAMESRRDGRLVGVPEDGRSAGFQRMDRELDGPRRPLSIAAAVERELGSARAVVEALSQRPRGRCRVSQVQTTRWGEVAAADEVLGLMLQRPAKSFIGMPLSQLVAGPERRVFAERARALLESASGTEWETRLIAPGARVGVPVAISVERGEGNVLRWYIRDLTELRRAQARVMELEAITAQA
jgi:hypothetical protein